MDADTRHQLKQNELAEALMRLRELKDPRVLYSLVAVVVVVVAVVAWYGWRSSRQYAAEQSSQRLGQIQENLMRADPLQITAAQADLRALAADAANPALTASAQLLLARAYYDEALQSSDKRTESFQQAATVLEQMRASSSTPAVMRAAASFLLGSTYESLARFDDARKVWQELVENPQYVGTPYPMVAEGQLESLNEISVDVAFAQGGPPMPSPSDPGTLNLQTPIQLDAGGQPTMIPIEPEPSAPPPAATETPAEGPGSAQADTPSESAPTPESPAPAPSDPETP